MARPHTRRKRKINPITIETRKNKHREIRDCFNKLRKKYNLETVYGFFRQHYFIQPTAVDHIITFVDKEPVNAESASIVYKNVMSENFYL